MNGSEGERRSAHEEIVFPWVQEWNRWKRVPDRVSEWVTEWEQQSSLRVCMHGVTSE
jgi:hypothetical protein